MTITLKTNKTKPFIGGLFIAASDALSKHKTNADYVCDGTDDEQQILSAVDKYDDEDLTGVIQLSEGNFSISSSILLNTGLTFQGLGKNSTIITMENPTSTQPGIDAITNVSYPYGGVTIKDLCVIMPDEGFTGDAIHAGSGITIKDFKFGGGTSDTWGVHFENAYLPTIKNVNSTSTHLGQPAYPTSNGIWLHQNPSGPNYEEVHYGDGLIQNVGVVGASNDFTAFKFTGAWFDMAINRILANHVGGYKGVGMDCAGLYDCSIVQFDFEMLETAIIADPIWNCQFMSNYMAAETILDWQSGGSTVFIGGTDPGTDEVTWII